MAEKKKRKRTDSLSPSSCDKSISSEISESTSLSCVSMKSDRSRIDPPSFDPEKKTSSQISGAESTGLSCVSLKSNRSRIDPPSFDPEKKTSKLTEEQQTSCSGCEQDLKEPVQLNCGHWLCKQCVSSEQEQFDSPEDCPCPKCGKKFKKDPKHQRDVEEDTGDSLPTNAMKNLKKAMQEKYTLTSEGSGDQQSSLNSIYTELYITSADIGGPESEHESRRAKRILKRESSDQIIRLNNIFIKSCGQEKPHRTVLTNGVAGIGKSFAVQKLVLDWAEEKSNKNIDFVFCLAFRELNLIRGDKSLHQLLTEFHPALSSLKDSENYVKAKIVVILDGLDESRFHLDFISNEVVTSVSAVMSLSDLLVNLIQGNLLPNANLWITSRPAASSQIPAKYVDMVTEIKGFNDPQKEDYFRNRFSQDSGLADRIISHVQSSQSLSIMCQIPIFCWISAVLFEEVFRGDMKAEIPQTLTEMMAHFLLVQMKRRSRKYDMKTEDNKEKLLQTHREFLLKLGKLAFVHLQKNNLIFYEDDLEDCGIDIKEASVYSGFCNAVLREEEIFSQRKVFFFVHLTIQEFFAALFVFDCFTNNKKSEISDFLSLKDKEQTLMDLFKMTVDKVMERKNGYLDLFLQFLLGLLVEPNRRVLQGLLTLPDPNQDTDRKILTYLKSIRRKTLSPDGCINLFQTMVEMRDHKVKDEIQEFLKLQDRSKTDLTPLHCSALAYMLQVSKDDLEVLDLKSYNTSVEGRRRLIPAARVSRKAILADCKVAADWFEPLVLSLKFLYSHVRDLDLSNNDLKDSGVALLCEGLSSQCCNLEILSLSGCLVTEKGCDHLALALKSNPSHLTELDLSYNYPGDTGEKLLLKLRDDPLYKLSKIDVRHGGSHCMTPGFKKYACELTLEPNTAHKNLLFSEGNRKVTWVEEQQSDVERFDQCQQVLCEQGLDGRCYFELEVLEPFNIGLTYRTIGRTGAGNSRKLGHNKRSWSLTCSNDGCYVLHGGERIGVVSHCSRSSRVGVYLDRPNGILSFYRGSSDSRTRLHSIKAEFSDPLYPAVEVYPHSSVCFCQLRE